MKQDFSPSQKAKIQFVIGLLAAGVVALVVLLILLFWTNFQQRTSQESGALPAATNVSTTAIPTPDCGSPTLILDSITFQIQNLSPANDGSLNPPADTSGIAYWVESTDTNYVFILNSTTENIALQTTLTMGDLATIRWTDCTTVSFEVSAIDGGQLNDPALIEQSKPGISLFVRTDSTTSGFVINGDPPEEITSVIDTPRPDESGILAEVSLLETTTSPDGTTIKVGISILNYGQTAFTLSPNNISLTPPDTAPLALISSEPALPKEIHPGSVETFFLTFPRPSAQIATLKIFTVEYDIEGY